MGKFTDALREEVGSYDNTEWSGDFGKTEVTICAQPLTPADLATIGRKHPHFTTNPTLEGMVDLIILKCKDEHGHKAFDKGDKVPMMRVHSNKIGEIFAALFAGQMEEYSEEDLEEDVKN